MMPPTLQWTAAVVHDLLHYPQRLLQHHTWAAVIADAGGLQPMRQQLLDFPLKAKERRILAVILTNPEASVVRYTDLLAIHQATFHRHQQSLCRSLSQFLNTTQAPAEPPVDASALANPARLVLPWTSFIGRQDALSTLHQQLTDGVRWITLVGTGGVGKTRLAMEVAHRSHGDAVYVLRFADVQRVEDVGLACVQQLQLVIAESQSIEQALQHFFQQRRSLVIVDNLEHLPAAGAWLAAIFAAVPQQQILATSRVRLNVPNEHVYEVAVLAYPPDHASPEQVRQSPAVHLCLDRMDAVRLVDRTDDHLLAQVGQICRHVAGLPLAIELVAARTGEYPLETVLAAITTDLGFLAEGPLDVDARQQTMEATIGWSYHLLPVQSQQVMQQLAVFRAGWDEAAAAAIGGLDPELMADHLVLLADNHLISRIDTHQYQPYTILEPIRHYLWAIMSAEQQALLRSQHCAYYCAWVMPSEDLLLGAEYVFWGQSMREAYGNIRLALETARAADHPRRLWQLLAAMYRFWWQNDLMAEAQSWIMPHVPALLTLSDDPYWRARALYTTLIFSLKDTNDYPRETIFNALVQLAQQHDFKLIEARAKNFYAVSMQRINSSNHSNDLFRIKELLLDAINMYRDLGDTVNILAPMLNYGNLVYGLGQVEEAYRIYAELREKFKLQGDFEGVYSSMKNMAVMCIYLGKYAESEDIILEILHKQYFIFKAVDQQILYAFLMKVYFFLGQYQKMDECAQKLYPIAIDNPVFIDRVLTVCEALIYLAIAKACYPIVLTLYYYMVNAVAYEQSHLEWYQAEFIHHTKMVVSQFYERIDDVPDATFILDYHSFNDTINYVMAMMIPMGSAC